MTAMSQPSRSVLALPCLAFGLFAAAALAPRQAPAQSFDCRAAHYPDEIAICRDSDLARLDQRLATAYRRGVGALAPDRRDEFQRHEIYFLNARRRCGFDRQCIAQSYRNRLHELENLMALGKDEEGGDTATAGVSPSSSEPDRSEESRATERHEIVKSVTREVPGPAAGSRPEPQSATSGRIETRSHTPMPAEPASANISRVETRPPKAAHSEPQPTVGSTTPPADEAATVAKRPPHKSHHHDVKRQQQTRQETAAVTPTPAPPPPEPERTPVRTKQRSSAAAPAKPAIEWANPPPSQ